MSSLITVPVFYINTRQMHAITTNCVLLTCTWPPLVLCLFAAALSFTFSARLRAALSQEKKLLRTFCSRSLHLFHFLFIIIIILASLPHSNYLHSSSVQFSVEFKDQIIHCVSLSLVKVWVKSSYIHLFWCILSLFELLIFMVGR